MQKSKLFFGLLAAAFLLVLAGCITTNDNPRCPRGGYCPTSLNNCGRWGCNGVSMVTNTCPCK